MLWEHTNQKAEEMHLQKRAWQWIGQTLRKWIGHTLRKSERQVLEKNTSGQTKTKTPYNNEKKVAGINRKYPEYCKNNSQEQSKKENNFYGSMIHKE